MAEITITQHGICRLTDDDVRALVLALEDSAGDRTDPVATFWRNLATALRRALADRRRKVAVLELDALDDEDEGGLVESDVDPVAAARASLRRSFPDGP